jgi:ribonuclease P protein component
MRAAPKAAHGWPSEDVSKYGFPSRYKLLKTDEYSSVFSFRRRFFMDGLTIHYMPNALGYPRLGIVVGKKAVRRAVDRNYVKRVVREWFRRHREMLGDVDLVVQFKDSFGKRDYRRMAINLDAILKRLQRGSSHVVTNRP